jgi:exo-beta-1,3-glucanase (GH17 family)
MLKYRDRCVRILSRRIEVALLILSLLAICSLISCGKFQQKRAIPDGDSQLDDLISKATSLCWVAYSPTNFDPDAGIRPPLESVKEDLVTLRQAGFSGLVTYGAGIVDDIDAFAEVADSLGFQGLIVGVWDPTNQDELASAIAAAQHEIVCGICIGNEGLDRRYTIETLTSVINYMSDTTHKLVTTTEELEDYNDPAVVLVGDWLFPNVHPYWHGIGDPDSAVQWTVNQYTNLSSLTDKLVLCKEVGMPTAGATGMSETIQAEYYRILQDTEVKFVFFEAFDQLWKQHEPVEPYWGLFRADRSPKVVIGSLRCDGR